MKVSQTENPAWHSYSFVLHYVFNLVHIIMWWWEVSNETRTLTLFIEYLTFYLMKVYKIFCIYLFSYFFSCFWLRDRFQSSHLPFISRITSPVWMKRAETESAYYWFKPNTFLPNSLACSYIAADSFDTLMMFVMLI